jgi:hypothetical protein
MKRRQVLAALGAVSGSGALLTGTGAFTSVSADRNIAVRVADDSNAFLRLAPCPGSDNGGYVDNSNGLLTIDLSESNGNDPPAGKGVNLNAVSVFDNVFQIANQGTQDVCVDFEVDVPQIPSGADVPERYDFGPGDPAVVFYRGSSRDDYVISNRLNPDRDGAIQLPIQNGNAECIGFEVRAFGFNSGTKLFENANLTIRADANANCSPGGGNGTDVADPTPTNPVGYWPFDNDDIDDGLATDVSGNGNDGTVEGPTSETGVGGGDGNAAGFDGTDDYISVDSDPTLTFGDGSSDDPFTVSAWVYIPKERNTHVLGKGYNTSSLEYLLNVDTNREWVQLRMYSGSGTQTIYRRAEFPSSNTDEWHHVAGTYDGSGAPSGITVYVDGTEPTTVETRDTNYTAMDNRGDDVEIGAVLRGDDQYGGFFKGRIDELRVYDRDLTATEMQSLADRYNP